MSAGDEERDRAEHRRVGHREHDVGALDAHCVTQDADVQGHAQILAVKINELK